MEPRAISDAFYRQHSTTTFGFLPDSLDEPTSECGSWRQSLQPRRIVPHMRELVNRLFAKCRVMSARLSA